MGKKIYQSDNYYLRSSDWKVIPIGVFDDNDEGYEAAFEAADTHATSTGGEVLICFDSDMLLKIKEELERAFEETHKDFMFEEDETNG
jgi:hypothetical protein